MVRQKIVRLLTTVLVLVTMSQLAATAHASQQNVSLHGITVSPAIEYIKLKYNQNNTTFETTLTNHTKSKVRVTPSVRDFTASSDGRKLTFIKDQESSSNSHGLRDSIKVNIPDPILNPGQSLKIPVAINDTDDLEPGGHYAAVVYGVKSVGSANKNVVSVNEGVSCLIFLDTFSGGTQKVQVAAFPVNGFVTSLPQNANIVLANVGNTQTIPRGYVQITGPGGKTVAQGIVNVDSGMILPDSKRLYPVPLSSHGNKSFFGVYHEKLFYRHDGQDDYDVFDQKFFYVNVLLCTIAAIGVILIGIAAYYLIKIVRKIIKQHPKGPKRKTPAPPTPRKPQKFMDIK